MTTRLFPAALAILAPFTPARGADDDAIKKEMKKLEGTWQLVSLEFDGHKLSVEKDERMVIAGDTFTIMTGDTVHGAGKFKVAEVKGKIRKTDLEWTKGEKEVREFNRNIAEWTDDDSFRTCTASGGKRPTEITAARGTSQAVLVFKRVTKK